MDVVHVQSSANLLKQVFFKPSFSCYTFTHYLQITKKCAMAYVDNIILKESLSMMFYELFIYYFDDKLLYLKILLFRHYQCMYHSGFKCLQDVKYKIANSSRVL